MRQLQYDTAEDEAQHVSCDTLDAAHCIVEAFDIVRRFDKALRKGSSVYC